nr:hypothetical protein [uncultured Clostridium sp.]
MKILRGDVDPVQSEQDDEQDIMEAILSFCTTPKSSQEIIEHFKMPNRSYFKRHYLDKLVKTLAGWVQKLLPAETVIFVDAKEPFEYL